jgi:hypothetical protein
MQDSWADPRATEQTDSGFDVCFLGLTWQHTRGSALLGWVKDDARFIAERIAARERQALPVQPRIRERV